MPKATVSIIIANNSKDKQSKKFLNRCLSSIKKNTSSLYKVVVEDGANLGPAKARNLGAKKARGKYLLFLDYDTVVAKDFLKKTIAFLEKNPQIGGGQLKLLRLDKKAVFDSAGEKLTPFGFLAERAQNAKDYGQFDQVENIFSGKGAAMIVRKSLFEKIGGFDEDYFMYWEEPDLTWRIWKLGKRFVFLPMDTVYHAYGSKEKKIPPRWEVQITYLGCRNQLATIIKNGVGFAGLKMVLGVTGAWLAFLLLFLLKVDFAKAKSILRAYFWIIRNFKVLLNKRGAIKRKIGPQFFSDSEWRRKIKEKRPINWYLGKALAYITSRPY